MKLTKLAAATAIVSCVMATNAFAGTWQTGSGVNQGKWWYDQGNGSYASNGWQWIDGNGDGTAESYYFDNNGWLLTDTTTPDGYQVNADGAWVENGTVQSQKVMNANDSAQDIVGKYAYCKTQLYVKNETTQTYELYGETPVYELRDYTGYDSVLDERYKLGQGGDFSCFIEIKNAGQNKIEFVDDIYHDFFYELRGNEWVVVGIRRSSSNEIEMLDEASSADSETIVFDDNTLAFVDRYTGRLINEGHPINQLAGKELMEKRVFTRYES